MNTNQYIDGAYMEKVQDWHVSDSIWKASKVVEMIKKHHISFNTVYDIGCGAGEILVQLQQETEKDVELIGFDISPQAISLAKPRENDHLKFFNEDFTSSSFLPPDLILLLDVFEHVPDYIGFLDALRKKTDWIILHIPLEIGAKTVLRRSDYMMVMRETFGHLHFFTKETAIAAISDIGFDVIDHFYTDDYEVVFPEPPNTFKSRISYEVRKYLFRVKPDLAGAIFEQFNLLLLARGDKGKLAK